jgi:Protein of unknown function (DUF3489)
LVEGRPDPLLHAEHARIIAMLRRPAGAAIAGTIAATDWQQHSVRGRLAGVVRKKLGLNLVSDRTNKGAGRPHRSRRRLAIGRGSRFAAETMQNKHRNGGASTGPVEGEIAHLRGLDLRGLRLRWLSLFGKRLPLT